MLALLRDKIILVSGDASCYARVSLQRGSQKGGCVEIGQFGWVGGPAAPVQLGCCFWQRAPFSQSRILNINEHSEACQVCSRLSFVVSQY
jgi:hypothetical protein